MLIFVIFFLIRSIFTSPVPYKEIDFDVNNNVTNYSSIKYADTLSHIGLDYLKVRNSNIYILDAKPHVIRNILPNERVSGFVIENQKNTYQIYLDPDLSRSRMLDVLAHELIHIEQRHSNRLEILDIEYAVFEGDTLSMNEVSYRDRPWEIEAYKDQREVKRHIKSIVF